MKRLINAIKSFFQTSATPHFTKTNFCNDPIVIADLGRRVEHKEAFFNLYVRCACESGSSFHVYLARMIRSCRLHMLSLPVDERKSFFEFCLNHKVDISDSALEIANQNEKAVFSETESFVKSNI